MHFNISKSLRGRTGQHLLSAETWRRISIFGGIRSSHHLLPKTNQPTSSRFSRPCRARLRVHGKKAVRLRRVGIPSGRLTRPQKRQAATCPWGSTPPPLPLRRHPANLSPTPCPIS